MAVPPDTFLDSLSCSWVREVKSDVQERDVLFLFPSADSEGNLRQMSCGNALLTMCLAAGWWKKVGPKRMVMVMVMGKMVMKGRWDSHIPKKSLPLVHKWMKDTFSSDTALVSIVGVECHYTEFFRDTCSTQQQRGSRSLKSDSWWTNQSQ